MGRVTIVNVIRVAVESIVATGFGTVEVGYGVTCTYTGGDVVTVTCTWIIVIVDLIFGGNDKAGDVGVISMGEDAGQGLVHVGTEIEITADGSVEGTGEIDGIVGKVAVFTETHLWIGGTATVEMAGVAGFVAFVDAGIIVIPVVTFKVEAGNVPEIFTVN